MTYKLVIALGLKNSRVLLFIYRKYISIRYKNLFNEFIPFNGYEINIGKDLSLFPSVIRGDFEQREFQMIGSLNKLNGEVIWDIGANVGLYSIFFENTFRKSKILSFEPAESTYALLLKNLEHNKSSRVLTFKLGLGISNVEASLTKSPDGAGSNSIVLKKSNKASLSEKIQMTSMDILINSIPEYAPKFIKIDVEGYEPQVILGGKNYITESKPIIMMEVFPHLWQKESYPIWNTCLEFLLQVYRDAFVIENQKTFTLQEIDVVNNRNQRTIFFGLT
jgi:FkbM family methyltransferase